MHQPRWSFRSCLLVGTGLMGCESVDTAIHQQGLVGFGEDSRERCHLGGGCWMGDSVRCREDWIMGMCQHTNIANM
jgi:hypothetical protein